MYKIICVFLSFCLLFSSIAQANESVALFEDNKINYLKFITGYSDNTFRPNNPITRAESAKMLSFVLDLDTKSENTVVFSDLNNDFWAYDAIISLSDMGVFSGFGDGTFRPEKRMTRAEFVSAIARILKLKGKGSAPFNDTKDHWAGESISALYYKKVIGGYPDKTFRPDSFITRAEAVVLINKITENYIDKNVTKKIFTDLSEFHWAYYDIMSAASTAALESTFPHIDVNFNDIEYIELSPKELKSELDCLLEEFKTAHTARQGEIFNQISTIESDVALAVSMSGINSKRDVTSEKDQNNTSNAYYCGNLVKEAKKTRYYLLAEVENKKEFESVIGMKIEDVPLPEATLPERLVALYTEEQTYKNEFNEFMYGNSITFNGQKYSLAQAEVSNNPKLVKVALDYYVDNEEVYGEIFSKLIDVRNRIAHHFGYRYYTDVGYLMSGKTFTIKNVEPIRNDVKAYIAPLFYNLNIARQGVNNGYHNTKAFTPENKTTYIEEAKKYIREMSPQTREALHYLIESEVIDTEVRQNKAQVSMTSYIDKYETPFLFINQTGSFNDFQDFAHEFGHAFHAYRIGKKGISSSNDICEIASYGMEMLVMHKYESFFDDNYKDVVLSDFYEKLALILTTTFMDEFQTIVYSDPHLTIKERNAIYAELRREYFIGSVYSHEAYERGICWTNPTHFFTAPYYSIDYTLALTLAFQLWEIGNEEGFDKEFEKYMDIIETPFMKFNISYVAVGAGLKSPFKKGVIKELAEKLDEFFKIN